MIPVVNLDSPTVSTATAVCQALKETGFLYVREHGISPALQRRLLETARRFFTEPLAFKQKIAMPLAGRAWRGYFPVGGELTANSPDLKEGLYFGEEHSADHPGVVSGWPMHGQNLWPGGTYAEMKPTVRAYMNACSKLGERLLRLVATGLGLEGSYFHSRFTTEPTQLFRIFNYPVPREHEAPTDPRPVRWGVGEHTDMGFLTLLLQDTQGGLEVRTVQGDWIPAPPLDDTLVVNIGDMLEFWTHGIFRATPHRVRNSTGHDRISLPFFFDPNWESSLEQIPKELLSKEDLVRVPSTRCKRWDGLDLHQLTAQTKYGDFVWAKIRHVFPKLAESTNVTGKKIQ